MSECAQGETIDVPGEGVWLATREARATLAVRRKPYWHPIDSGQHLGYYKGARSGTWRVRIFVGGGRYEEARLGKADDTLDADGVAVLDYGQAVARSREWLSSKTRVAPDGFARGGIHESCARHRIKSRARTDRLDEITLAWQRERPDFDLNLVGLFMRFERTLSARAARSCNRQCHRRARWRTSRHACPTACRASVCGASR